MSDFIAAFAQQLQRPTLDAKPAAESLIGLLGWDQGRDLDLRVYRNTIALAERDALRANYPSLCSLLGDDYVDALGTRYAQDYPNDQPSLLHLGQHLAAWLQAHSSDTALGLPPYAAALAQLDRAWTLCHCATDALPIVAADIAGLMEQEQPLQSHPAALSFFDAQMPTAALFLQSRVGVTDFSSLVWEGGGVLLSRPEQHVQLNACSAQAHHLLQSFSKPHSLTQMLSQAESAQEFGAALFELVTHGALMVAST